MLTFRRILFISLFVTVTLYAQSPTKSDYYQPPGTKRMAELLRKIYHEQDFRTDPNKDDERAQYYRAGLQQKLDVRTELKARMALANALLNAGDSAGAVTELENLRTMMRGQGIIPAAFFVKEIRQLLAIAYLRVGEQENCVLNHGNDSCIFPIRPAAQHQLRRGAEGAVRELTAILQDDPNDLSARWLLNIAHMVLGEYPAKPASRFLIASELFKSDFALPKFSDVAPALKLDITRRAGGCVWEDFDGDGFLDLLISSSGPLDQLHFFHCNGDGTFAERTKESGLLGITGGLNLIHTDYNNDGLPDALVLRGGWFAEHGKYPPSLLKNNGDGTFDDVTEAAGLMSLHPTQTAAWADYDNDGWLDLFIGHESNVKEKHPSQLFHNNKNGMFTDVGAQLGLSDLGYVKGVTWGDFNNDGRPDLYVSRKGEPNKLFRNDGAANPKYPNVAEWKFTDVTAQAGVAEPLHSFATWWWDYDNDGWQDLFVAGYYTETLNDIGAFMLGLPNKAETPRLYHNNHNGTFTEVSKQMKLERVILPMGSNFGDLDNDGWLDCYFGTGTPQYEALLPNKMFRNDGGKIFQDVTTAGGFGHLQKGHAVSFADINNDGADDVFAVIGGALLGDGYQSVLFANPGSKNHWVKLKLSGVKSNAAGLGTRVKLRVKTKSGFRDIYRTISSGGSFGDSPFRLHVGLGDAVAIDEVEIYWPTSGITQRLKNLALDKFYRVVEGQEKALAIPLKTFAFPLSNAQQHVH